MPFLRNRLWPLAAVAVCLFVTACGSSSSSSAGTSSASTSGDASSAPESGSDDQKLTPITVAGLPIANIAPLYLGIQKGFFRDEGLDVTVNPVAVTEALPQLLQGDVQFIDTVWLSLIVARAQNVPIVAVAPGDRVGADDASDYCHMVTPANGASSLADLGGKTVAIAFLKSSSEVAARDTFKAAGVDPDSVKYTQIPWANMGAALRSGRVDAGLVCEPFLTQLLEQGGVNDLGGAQYKVSANAPISVYITSEKIAKEDPELVASFQRAILRSLEHAQAHVDEARDIVPTFTDIDAATAGTMILPSWGTTYDERGIQTLATQAQALGIIPDAVDVSSMTIPLPSS